MSPDFFNALFEVSAGFFVLNHCRVLFQHKSTRGVSIVSTIFFCFWGFWNIYYYPAIGQFWSFAGGVFVVIANTVYVVMMLHYNKRSIGWRVAE